MNKKGSILLSLVIGAIIIVGLIIILAIPKLRILILSLSFIAAGIIAVLNKPLNRTRSIFVVAFITIGLLTFFLGSYLIPQEVLGSSVLSLEKADYYSSSSACFDSPVNGLWLYTIRGGGLSQYAQGSYTPSEIGNANDGDEQTTKTFIIDTKFDQFCQYPLITNPSATSIYTLSSIFTWSSGLFGDTTKCISEASTKPECLGTDGYFAGKIGGQLKCYCTKYTKKTGAIGSSPNFNSPSTKTDMKIDVTVGTQKYTQSFSSEGAQIKGKIGPNTCAIWQGNLVTGQTCGLPSSDVTPAYINGNWVLLSKDKYDIYRTDWSTLLSQFNAAGTEEGIKATIVDLNSKANTALNSRVSFGAIDKPTQLVGAKVIKTLTELIQPPILSMYVKADWVGVVTPVPQPDITSISSECFKSGADDGVIKTTITNKGTERGEISVYGTCTEGFNVKTSSLSLLAGDTKTIYLNVEGTTDTEKLIGSCTITADALENKDTSKVDVCVTGFPVCNLEQDDWCEDGNVWECKNIFNPSIKENCISQGEICEYDKNGVAYCKGGDPVCGNGICEKGETKLNCKVDCDKKEDIPCDEKTPTWMGWTEVTTEKQTLWSRIAPKIFEPRAETYCKPTNAPYIFGGAIIIILGLAALLIFKPVKKIKGKSTKFGKIGK